MCWQEELLRGELEPQGLFSHLIEGDLVGFQGWDAVCAILLMDLLEPWPGVFGMGLWGSGGDHLQGRPCILSPAAPLNKESFSLLFLLHPDTFLLVLFLLLTHSNYSWSRSIEFSGELGSLYHKNKTGKTL